MLRGGEKFAPSKNGCVGESRGGERDRQSRRNEEERRRGWGEGELS